MARERSGCGPINKDGRQAYLPNLANSPVSKNSTEYTTELVWWLVRDLARKYYLATSVPKPLQSSKQRNNLMAQPDSELTSVPNP